MTTTDRILAAVAKYVPIPYGTPANRHDLSKINCSTLTAHVLDDVLSYRREHGGVTTSSRPGLSTAAWLDIVVGDPDRPWSPIDRAVADGWAEEPPQGIPTWSGWYILQGWRTIPTHGHAMLAHAAPDWAGTTDPLIHPPVLAVLEATNAGPAGGYGVRWRGAPTRAPLPLSLDDAPRLFVADLETAYPAGVRWARLVGL